MKIKTRFAPSPTGSLHIGGVRTALYNYLFAKQNDGEFLLRIEDTDQLRSTQRSANGIIEDLQWLGLHHDGEVIYQSKRLNLYKSYADQMISNSSAFVNDSIIRLNSANTSISLNDSVYGNVVMPGDDNRNFVLIKSDGFPTYHFAVVVDDMLCQITHVLRGSEHLMNTSKHIEIQQALNANKPIYAHLPCIINPDGTKLSKRDKARTIRKHLITDKVFTSQMLSDISKLTNVSVDLLNKFINEEIHDPEVGKAFITYAGINLPLPMIEVSEFRAAGYLPEAILNYVALLGWSPGNNLELMSLDDMIANFSLQRVRKASAKFSIDKLNWFNKKYLSSLPESRILHLLNDWLATSNSHLKNYSQDKLKLILSLYKDREATFQKISDATEYLANSPIDFNLDSIDVNDFKFNLNLFHSQLAASNDIKLSVQGAFAEKTIRLVLKGNNNSPPIPDLLSLFTKEEVLKRINYAQAYLQNKR